MATGDLPEGVDLDDVRRHATTLTLTAMLVNLSSDYLEAEEGHDGEAETALDEHVGRIVDLGPEACGAVMLALASLVNTSGDQAKAQAFLDEQWANIRAALDGRE